MPGNERAQQILFGLVPDLGETLCVATQQQSGAHLEHHASAQIAISGQAHNVQVPSLGAVHALLLGERIETGQHVTHARGALEVERCRGFAHADLHVGPELFGLALQDTQDLVGHLAIVGLALQADAGCLTAPDVVVEARAVGFVLGEVVAARAHGMQSLHDLERLPHGAHRRVGAEVARTVVHDTPRDVYTRKRLPHGDFDVGILLVVPHEDVEARPILLDEVGLEDERFGLRADHQRVHALDEPNQLAILGAQVRLTPEVAAHAATQRLRLADVEHALFGVLEQIDAGLRRECA